MEPFNIHILGCGCALPTGRHNPSAQIVEVRGKYFLVDCGEGTQLQLRRAHVRFTRLTCIFISHLHGDHCLGLVGLISTFALLGRTAPLHICAPAALADVFDVQMKLFCAHPGYDIIFHAVDTTVRQTIYEDRSITVETLPLEHRVPCCGYLFAEKKGLPHIDRAAADFYGVPVSQYNNIKNGGDWTDDEGHIVAHTRLTKPADTPRSYAYCSDTRFLPQLGEALRGVTTLYHEATYSRIDADRAAQYCHSTAAQAAEVARIAGVGKLIIGHYSARYDDESILLDEAREIFPHTVAANEGDCIAVKAMKDD